MRAAPAPAALEGGAEEIERCGTLVALRRVSARLFFGDLECDEGACSLVFKRERCDVAALRRELRQGDAVRVRGAHDGEREGLPTLLVATCAVLQAWKEAGGGVAFVPRPAPAPSAGTASAVSPQPCKFWVNTGRCARGDRCGMAHDRSGAASCDFVAGRKAGRARLAAASGDPHAGAAKAKAARAALFADFLVSTFGLEALRRGSGVLDVAGGGAGGVAFELTARFGVPVTVVDPRPPALCRRTAATLAHAGAGALTPTHCGELFTAALARERFAHASAVVGMHPDQATDAVVDAALALRCPFAVVPCCVFPALFAHARRTPDGRRVTSRDQLVDFLLARAPGSQAAWLPFQGANRVVFSPPHAEAALQSVSPMPLSLAPRWWDERSAGA